MSDTPSGPESSSGETETRPASRPLFGGATIRELEEREREMRHRATEAERAGCILRAVGGLLALFGAGYLVWAWRPLAATRAEADRDLKAIHLEVEAQLGEALRYVPLHDSAERATRKHLEDARAEMVAHDFAVRVRGIRAARQLLAARMPRAKAAVRRDWAPLYDTFVRRYRLSEQTVREQTQGYNRAASRYNQTVKSFPANLIQALTRYPERLPALKP